MLSRLLYMVRNIFKYKIRSKGIVIMAVLTICYLIQFQQSFCSSFGGVVEANFTGFLVLILSDKFFLTFMIPLTIVYGVSEMSQVRLIEIVQYKERHNWSKTIVISGIAYTLLYFLFILCVMAMIAVIAGIDFNNLKVPCDNMDYVIPSILKNSENVNMVNLAIVNTCNAFLYCITIGMLYPFLLSLTKRRTIAVLLESLFLVVILTATTQVMRQIYPFITLGNVVLNVSYNKLNMNINWTYWIIVNLALFGLTFYINSKREYDHDEKW